MKIISICIQVSELQIKFHQIRWFMTYRINFESQILELWNLPTTQILKIQYFLLGMLIFGQKCFYFLSLDLKLNNWFCLDYSTCSRATCNVDAISSAITLLADQEHKASIF